MDTNSAITTNESARIVKQALSFEAPDRLPVFEGKIWPEFVDNWRKQRNVPANENFEDLFHLDLRTLRPMEQFFPTRIGEIGSDGEYTLYNDGWGRIVRQSKTAQFTETVERLLNQPSDLDKIEFDPASLDVRYTNLIEQAQLNRDKGKAVFVNTGGPFIRSSFFRGETEFLMDLAADEVFAKALVEKVGAHLMNVGLEALKRADVCDFGIWIYDDMCNINSPMFSPETFERIFLPVYKKMVSAYKAAGARWVILHCDGNLLPFLDLLIEAGIDGINPVEHAAGMDVVQLIKKYYGRLSFIGGVCNTQILPSGDKHKIQRHVEAIVKAGQNGGLIIGTHSVGPDISLQSYELYRQIIATQGIV